MRDMAAGCEGPRLRSRWRGISAGRVAHVVLRTIEFAAALFIVAGLVLASVLARGPIRLGVFVQMAEPADDVANASVPWPNNRAEVPFCTITLNARVDDQEPEWRKIIFDPVPRVDGIDPSGDPLTEVRADIYLLSGRRRRAAGKK